MELRGTNIKCVLNGTVVSLPYYQLPTFCSKFQQPELLLQIPLLVTAGDCL